jgi:putative nucleotidyltransferase with HDIG domain
MELEITKILFVDDEASILEIVNEYFQVRGYHVFTALNGKKALEILQQNKIDCCFTDINMPEMNGLELAEHIRKIDNSIPVVIMTGYPSLDRTIKTIKNGVVDFLIKPLKLDQLELCLGRVLRERKMFEENILLKKEIEHKQRIEKINTELTKKVEELYILNKIMTNLTSISSSAEIFNIVVEMAKEITHADESQFYLANDAVKIPFKVACSSSSSLTNNTPDELKDEPQAIEKLILEIISDEIPLLISDNQGARGLPGNILSFMIVPLKIREKVFGVLTASVKQGATRFDERDLYYLSFMTHNTAYAIENLALYENIYENLFSTLYAFVKTLEARDIYTQLHSDRVSKIATCIAKEMGCSSEELDIIAFAGRLHDIGKIGIRDDILLKPGKLTKDEFEVIKEHPTIGAAIIGQLGLWDNEQYIIKCHHERYDGKGYPSGLEKDKIPLLARILSVADAFDAMDSDRAYRKKVDMQEIITVIQNGAGTQFDPNVVDVFCNLFREGKIMNDQIDSTVPISNRIR